MVPGGCPMCWHLALLPLAACPACLLAGRNQQIGSRGFGRERRLAATPFRPCACRAPSSAPIESHWRHWPHVVAANGANGDGGLGGLAGGDEVLGLAVLVLH